jgi:hypothetical protein
MPEPPTIVDSSHQPPVWLFDLESKSFFLGFVRQTRDPTLEPISTPIIFALPRVTPLSHANTQTSDKQDTSQPPQQLTLEVISKISAGPFKLEAYTSRYESWEHILVGKPTNRGLMPMAKKMMDWENSWKIISGG